MDSNDDETKTRPSRGGASIGKKKPLRLASEPGAVAEPSRPSSGNGVASTSSGGKVVSGNGRASRPSGGQADVIAGRIPRHMQRDQEAKERARVSGSSASTQEASVSTGQPASSSNEERASTPEVASQGTRDSNRHDRNEGSGEARLVEAEIAPDIDDAVQRAVQNALKSHEASQQANRQQNQDYTVAQAQKVPTDDDDLEDEDKICGMPRRLCFCLLIVVVAAIAGGVGGGIAASRSNSASDDESPPATAAPSAHPTAVPTSVQFLELAELLYPENFDSIPDEQYDAIEWIVEYDPRNLNTSFLYPELTERFSLATLFFATNGYGWNDTTLWLTGASHCAWFGVDCDPQDSVTGLNLAHQSLGGNALPPELGNLSKLQSADFYAAELWGSVPTEIGLLTALTYLDFSVNSITGTLPTEIGELTMLTKLSVSENDMFGRMPSEVGLLTMMENMAFAQNAFDGQIPTEIGRLTRLTFLSFLQNEFMGSLPSELGNLSDLTILLMGENRFSSTIPAELGNMASLEELFVQSNSLTGSVPSSLDQLTDLVQVYVNDNDLTAGLVDLFCDANLTYFVADCRLDCGCCTGCTDYSG
eukprot:scaffold1400_cov137-Cylindrotheca_fusiformis.AAC.1